MRIGIDARIYGPWHGGLGRYAMRLLEKVESETEARQKQDTSETSFVVFMRGKEWNEYRPKSPHFEKRKINARWYSWKEQILIPIAIQRSRVDLMHFLHFNVPLLCPTPFVVTVHDLITLTRPNDRATTLPKFLYRIKWLIHRAVIRSALERAQKVITPSEYTKQEIIRLFPKTEKKIVVIPMGIDIADLRSRDKLGTGFQISPRNGIPLRGTDFSRDENQKKSILYIGVAFPHKNLETLLAAFSMLRKNHPEVTLMIAGPKSFFFSRLQKWAQKNGMTENVRFVENPNDEEREILLRDAGVFAFPSLEEGFGLPPLEAASRGIPVVASDIPPLREVMNDAALFVQDPLNASAWAHALRMMLTDSILRNTLIQQGKKQAQKFSWEKTAQRTMEVYKVSLPRALSL